MAAVKAKLKLFVPAAGLVSGPPFGPILGQYGINTSKLCTEFNDFTVGLQAFFDADVECTLNEFLVILNVTIYDDRSYTFEIEKPPVSFLLRLLAKIKLGAPKQVVGLLTLKELYFIAIFKFPTLNPESACNIVVGAARSIGIKIIL